MAIQIDYVLNVPGQAGRAGAKTIISPQDIGTFETCKWRVNAQGYLVGAYPRGTRGATYFHRVIMGEPEGMVVDHINGSPLDNRRSNLRVVTQQHNLRNRPRLNRDNKSGYRGVSKATNGGLWLAQARFNGRQILIGRFKTAEKANEAAIAWRAVYYFGQDSPERISYRIATGAESVTGFACVVLEIVDGRSSAIAAFQNENDAQTYIRRKEHFQA